MKAQRVALPPDSALMAELCAPQYQLTPSGIKIEKKEDIIKRIGRSTDRADAVIMAAQRAPGFSITGLDRRMRIDRG